MFFATTIALALAAVSTTSALVVPRKSAPAGWATGYLEDYTVYHTRYLALDCQDKHGQPFFDLCCHPLLATETLEKNRDPSCTPSPAKASSAAQAEPTSTVTTPDDNDGDDDEDCEDDGDDEPTTTSTHSQTPAKATPAPAAQNAGDQPKDQPAHTTSTKSAAPKPKATPTNDNNNGNDNSNSGDISGGFATFFTQNGNAGSCGKVHSDSDLICAMDSARFQPAPGGISALCGKQVVLTNKNNGKSVTVTVADECPTCVNGNSIDLSVGAFTRIATEEEGMVPIEWHFA